MEKSKKIIMLSLIALMTLLCIPRIVFAAEEVAEVGETKYSTLQEAITNADGKEVTLLKSTAEDIIVSNTTTLNLNGLSLTNVSKDTIYVTINGNLTITGNGTIVNVTKNYAPLFNNGTTTITNGTIKRDTTNNNNYYVIVNHGIMTINDGTFTVNGNGSSLVDNGYSSFTNTTNERYGYVSATNQKDPMLTINGGTFNGGMNTIKNDDNGNLVINNGIFTNSYQVSLMNWNIATVNGGTFNTPEGNDKTNIFLGCDVIDGVDKGILTINGGTFNADYAFEGTVITQVKVTGGTFNNKNLTSLNTYIDSKGNTQNYTPANSKLLTSEGINITAGTFGIDVSKYVESGKTIAIVDGKYVIGTSEEVSKTIEENKNSNVSVLQGTATVDGKTAEVGTKATIIPNSTTQIILSTNDKKNIDGNLTVKPITDTTKSSLAITSVGNDSKTLGIFDISIVKDDNTVSVTDTPMTIKIKVGKDIIEKYTSFKFVYINNGVTETMDAVIDGEYLVLNTTHLSEYAIVGVGEKTNSEEATNPSTFDSIINCIIILTVSSLGILFSTRKFKKN